MEPLTIAEKIKEKFPEEVIEIREFRGQVSVILRKDNILHLGRHLHDDPDFSFDYLVDVCGVDYLGRKEKRFEVVYHLYSMKHRHMVRLRAEVPEEDASIDSVTSVWTGANWHEREAFDMYGIAFKGHPDLRRILMPEDWEGYPLRKDYPLKGPEKEWPGFQDVIDRGKRFSQFDWHEE